MRSGCSQRPLGPGLVQQWERIGPRTARRTGFDPVHQRARLVDRHRPIADEAAVVWVGVPWGHPLGANDFPDHRREAANHVVAGHGPGCYPARAVAHGAPVD